jgi:hypothetical protein
MEGSKRMAGAPNMFGGMTGNWMSHNSESKQRRLASQTGAAGGQCWVECDKLKSR